MPAVDRVGNDQNDNVQLSEQIQGPDADTSDSTPDEVFEFTDLTPKKRERPVPRIIDAGFGEEYQAAEAATDKRIQEYNQKAKNREDVIKAIRESTSGLFDRAAAMAKKGLFDFPDTKTRGSAINPVTEIQNTEMNRWHVFDLLFGDGPDRPHFDSFRGRIVDGSGRIVDDHYPVNELLASLTRAGVKGANAGMTRESFAEWALRDSHNDLSNRVMSLLPEWDGKPRLETWLLDLFECKDDQAGLNRRFSKYFALALYGRVMHPGCYAPIVMGIVGAQDCGKSFFSTLVSRWITGDSGLDASQWNLDASKNDNLRDITGKTPIVVFPEMGGLARSDINKFKAIASATSDQLHFKFEGTITQRRQFVFVLDSNEYASIHRDTTGNRRIHVLFAGQTDDVNGKPAWKPQPWQMSYDGFEVEFWQVMAEAAAFWSDHGQKKYDAFVGSVVKEVAAYNANEMKLDRGTMADEVLDQVLPRVLPKCSGEDGDGKRLRSATFDDPKTGERVKVKCLVVTAAAIREEAEKNPATSIKSISTQRLSQKMVTLGSILSNAKHTMYIFPQFRNENTWSAEFDAHIRRHFLSDGGDEVEEAAF